MKLLLAGTALVRVLGLGVVTDQVPNDKGVHIIMPRTHGPMTQPMQSVQPSSRTGGTATSAQQAPLAAVATPTAVEEHRAAIIFKKTPNTKITGWKAEPVTYPELAGQSIVIVYLDGEEIEITGDDKNKKTPVVDTNLPRLGGTCCSSMKALRPEYHRPYSGAAAVIHIKEGELSACRAANKIRIDTELEVKYGDKLRIAGPTSEGVTKEIVFDTAEQKDIAIAIVNVPPALLQGRGDATPYTAPHHHAYFQMAASGSCDAKLETCCEPLAGNSNTNEPCPRVKKTCRAIVFNRDAPPAQQIDFTDVTSLRAANFDCSNTTFP